MRLTISTCSAWLTNSTRPTLNRWARDSGGPSGHASRSSRRASRGTRTAEEGRAEEDEEADRAGVGEVAQRGEDVPHLLGREREQREDRQQRHRLRQQPERGAQLAGEPREHPAQDRQQPEDEDRVDQRQDQRGWRRPWSRRCRAGRRRSAAAAPAGSRRRRARSCRGGWGSRAPGRPWATLMTAIPASTTATPPSTASTFCHQVQSSWPAPSSSPRKTSPSSGAARLKTSVEAEKPSTNSGRPARRNCRS